MANIPEIMIISRFYEEPYDYLLAEGCRKRDFEVRFEKPVTVGKAIESLGVPLSEVDLILVNGRSVSFRYRLKDGDRVSVYPIFEQIDITGVTRVRKVPLKELKRKSWR